MTESDPTIDMLLGEYMQKVDSGEPFDREEFLQQHPEHAEELRGLIEADDLVRQLNMSEPVDTVAPTIVPGANDVDPQLGTRLRYVGDYELLDELARGGMGIVYKARQLSLNRIVAIKMIRAGELAYDDEIQRFQNEAEAVASLQHPNIVSVHEVGQHDGHSYFSMDLVEGSNLSDLVRENPLPVREAVRYVKQAAEAIQYAHKQGVLHRDIKPSNILVDRSGQVHITDFGLAKQVASDSSLTQTGQVLGTPSYMSPEQAAGNNALMGPASDVYSLGAVLYELVTGRPPFAAATPVETIRQVLDKESLSPRLLNTDIPRDLETICLKCLEKSPTQRYLAAEELVDELDRFLAGKPIQARPLGRVARYWRWCRRNPTGAALQFLAVTLFIVVAGATVWINSERQEAVRLKADAERQRDEANTQRKRAIAGEATAIRNAELAEELRVQAETAKEREAKERQTAERRAEERRWQLYVSQMFPTIDAWERKNYGHLERLLDESIPIESETDFRGWEWYFLRDQLRKKSVPLSPGDAKARKADHIAWHPQAAELAVSYQDRIEVWDPMERTHLRTLVRGVKGGMSSNMEWSPDGARLVLGTNTPEIIVLDATSGEVAFRINPKLDSEKHKQITAVSWSPDGQMIAGATWYGQVTIWSAKDGSPLFDVRKPRSVDFTGSLDWSPDSMKLAIGHRFGRRTVWDVKTQTHLGRRTNSGGVDIGRSIAWSPDGSRIAASNNSGIEIFDAAMNLIKRLYVHRASVSSIEWIDDNQLITASNDQTIRTWDVEKGTSEALRIHASSITEIALGTKKEWIASRSHDGSLKLTRIRGPEVLPATLLKAKSGSIGQILWHPKNDSQLAAIRSGAIRVWNLDDDRNEQSISIGIQRGAQWNSDGSFLMSMSYRRQVTKWNFEDSTVERSQIASRGPTNGSAWSPDTKLLAVGNNPGVELRDGHTLKLLHTFPDVPAFTEVEWNPNGQFIASTDNYRVAVIDLLNRKVVWNSRIDGGLIIVDWDPTGNLLVTGTSSGEIRILDGASGSIVHTLRGPEGTVTGVDWSPNGRRIAASGSDGKVHVYDAATGDHLIELAARNEVIFSAVSWNHNGQRLAAGTSDSAVYIWDAPQPEIDVEKQDGLSTGIIAKWQREVMESGRALIAANDTEQLHPQADVQNKEATPDSSPKEEKQASPTVELKLLKTFPVGEKVGIVTSVEFSPDAALLLTSNRGAPVRLWKWKEEQPAVAGSLDAYGGVAFARFSPDGKSVVSGGWHEQLSVWDVASRTMRWTRQDEKHSYLDATFTPDGKKLVAGRFASQHVEVIDAATGELITNLVGASYEFPQTNYSWPSVAFSPDAKLLATAIGGRYREDDGMKDSELSIWDAESFELLGRMPIQKLRVQDISFSHDSRFVASGAVGGFTNIWALEEIKNTTGEGESGEADRLINALNDEDGTDRKEVIAALIQLGPRVAPRIRAEMASSKSIFFRLRAQQVLDALAKQILLSRQLGPRTGHVHAVAFAPNRSLLATGRAYKSAGQIRLWDLSADDREFLAPNDENGANCIAFSRDGKLMATGSGTGTVSIWQVTERPAGPTSDDQPVIAPIPR